MKLSIVIANYNYARYVGAAIDSALAVKISHKEVIVVDDGSTDGSRDVISSYGDSITAIFQENCGQCYAAETGFKRSSGEIVIFLDSDDRLLETVAGEIFKVWGPRVSAVQFGQYHIDAEGRRTGSSWPNFTSADTPCRVLRNWRHCSYYLTPPTSGNAWSRRFIEQVLPLSRSTGNRDGRPPHKGFDDYLHLLAPAFGDVISLPTCLGEYRVHGENLSTFGRFDPKAYANFIDRDVDLSARINTILLARGEAPIDLSRSWQSVMSHVIVKRFLPQSYPPDPGAFEIATNFLAAVWRADEPLKRKLKLSVWDIVTSFGPERVAHALCAARAKPHRKSIKHRVTANARWALSGIKNAFATD